MYLLAVCPGWSPGACCSFNFNNIMLSLLHMLGKARNVERRGERVQRLEEARAAESDPDAC